MELRIQPKPEVNFFPANKGIVSKKQFFVKKHLEELKKNTFPALFIRHWRAKAEVLFPSIPDTSTIKYECYFNRNIQNHFTEDFAEEAYLRTPPPCFVVFGKRVNCSVELGKKLAENYGSVLMNVDDIVEQVLEMRTQTSKLLHDILRLGVPLTLNFILALLCYVAHTPEARHQGYVLCGLPTLAFLQDMPAEHQFNYLFTWDNKPTVFVYVLCQDEDLITERAKMKYEVRSTGKESSLLLHFDDQEVTDDEYETDDLYEIPTREETAFEPDIDISPSRPRVQLPRDEESRVWVELELFDAMIRPTIALIASRVDPQCLIRVDSRLKNSFEVVKSQMLLLPLWKSPMPMRFMPPSELKTEVEGEVEENFGEISEKESDYDEDILRVAEEPPQVAFLTLFTKKTLSPKFRWELSHYNYICPVSLREGEVVEGKSKFAVAFLKYIYFLRDQDCVTKFMRNPRAYVLPVRPKPLCRFFILGYPYSGKTTLARTLAGEFSIPLINVDDVLQDDMERKKNTYQEFCRQKAECRELIRLTALAWQDWRLEEERRVNLIEECILYLQSLLQRRIDQFYSAEVAGDDVYGKSQSLKYIQRDGGKTSSVAPVERKSRTKKSFISPSAEFIESVKEGRFNKEEANSYFSFVWKSFSEKSRSYQDKSTSEEEYRGEDLFEEDEDSEDDAHSVNWCDLLPPQSLSSFLISKLPYTTRVKRQSFKIFLEAASKAYHVPSKLKSEFAKWHLPCYMDIPLCGIFLENPLFLLKYVPAWLRERPLIPNPVDHSHPAVLAEGDKAYKKASLVIVRQNAEEQGILLRNAIEKVEREGMRVTGEVITPGGWVVDNMTLDPAVWKKLLCDKVFADHVYILIDSEPGNRRIINHWWENYGKNICSRSSLKFSEGEGEQHEQEQQQQQQQQQQQMESTISETTTEETEESSQTDIEKSSLISLLEEWVSANAKGDKQLDEIYEKLKPDIQHIKYFFPPFPVDPFCHSLFQNTLDNWNELKDDALHEETTYIIHTLTGLVSRTLFWSRELTASVTRMPLGSQLETCANALVDFYNTRPVFEDRSDEIRKTVFGCLDFFKYLHTLPGKLEQLKGVFNEAGRSETIEEVEIYGRTPEEVYDELLKKLMSPFIKKPRELEDFEIEEIKASTEVESNRIDEEEEEEEGEEERSETVEKESTEVEEREDIRIFGESGELCVVSLERNKYLRGKLEYSLRYFGKLYYFWNQDCKDKFIENPEKYAPYYSPIRCYPPLRVYVVGPTGSGRTLMSSAIAQQCNLSFIDVSKFLCQTLVPFTTPPGVKWDVILKKKLLLYENHNEPAKQLKDKFMRVPYGKRKFWLDHSFHTSYEDNKEMYDLLHKISINPVNFGKFPELKYSYIESAYDTYGEDYMEIQPKGMYFPEVPYMSMNEMTAYIDGDGLAESEAMEYWRVKSMKGLWAQNPYIQAGFILKSYPRRRLDVKNILENNWIPDLIIEMVLPEAALIARNVDSLMSEWQIKLKKELAEQEALELALTTIQSNCREIREKELLLERQKLLLAMHSRRYGSVESSSEVSDRASRPAIKSISKRHRLTLDMDEEQLYPSKIPESVKEEVRMILDKEFPTLIFKPVFETFYSAKERVINSLIKISRKDLAELDKIRPILNELDIPWLAVDGLKSAKENFTSLFIKLDKIRSREGQKKEFAFPVSMELAEKLLDQGYYFLSKFGRMCPVQALLKKNPLHMFTPLSLRGKITPIVYRNYLYYVGGEGEKLKFLKNPVKYIYCDTNRPNIPLTLAVIGPPKSGKSMLSKRLSVMFHLRLVTMGSALRMALEQTPHTTLAKEINSYLRRGCLLPLSLKVEALILSLTDPASSTQGYVIDGVPFDAALTQSLAERGKLPFIILSLVADPEFAKINREGLNLNNFRLPYKQRINLDTRYKDWTDTYNKFSKWNQDTFNNIYELNARRNSVDIFYQAFDYIKEAFFDILNYVKYCMTDKALSLKYMCIGHQEYLTKRSLCGNNCPVCWAEVNRLNCCTESRPKSGLVQYINHIYWICPKHMQKFLKNPKLYLPPKVPNWPELMPERIYISPEGRSAFEKMVHGYGRCPVTRIDFPGRLEWEGSWDFAASYKGKIFLCKNEDMLQRFLAQPWRYFLADTIFEAHRTEKSNSVVNLGPPKLSSLPPIGFLEQTVADLIHESLQNVGNMRPLYPNMHPRVTGCIFVALFLKVHNKRKKPCSLDRECLEFFFRNCQALKYKVTLVRPPEMGQGDFEPDLSDDSDSSGLENSRQSSEFFSRNWPDFETQAAKRMWSAKNVNKDYVDMKLTDKNDLEEIPEVPAVVAILRFQYHSLRASPLPPVDNCLNFIYSIPTKLQLPEKFNYNCLHQLTSQFSSPFTPQILFNPLKEFSQSLYHRKDQGFSSPTNLHHDRRTMSDCSVIDIHPKVNAEPTEELMTKGFFPRFQLLDKVTPRNMPTPPIVVEKEPLVLNPHFDHSYMMLLSEFFHTSHYLRCFDLNETLRHKELLDRLDETLELTNTQIEYIFTPRRTASMVSRTSVYSYQLIFDTVTPFLITTPTMRSSEIFNYGKVAQNSSGLSFSEFYEAITDKYEGSLTQISPVQSYDSFEINVVPTNSDMSLCSEVLIHEILAYPPMPWDIISRPYYAYCSIPSIFEKPHIENIAHERHVSLLDGITEINEEFRFVPFPTNVQLMYNSEASAQANRRKTQGHQCHFYFDFFNLPWTSFLTYRSKMSYSTDFSEKSSEKVSGDKATGEKGSGDKAAGDKGSGDKATNDKQANSIFQATRKAVSGPSSRSNEFE